MLDQIAVDRVDTTIIYDEDDGPIVYAWLDDRIGHGTHGTARSAPYPHWDTQCGCGDGLERHIQYRYIRDAEDPADDDEEEAARAEAARAEVAAELEKWWHEEVHRRAWNVLRRTVRRIAQGDEQEVPPDAPHGWVYSISVGEIGVELEHPQAYDPGVEISHQDLDLTDAERAAVAAYTDTDGVEYYDFS